MKKDHIIISIYAGKKAFDKIQYLFIIKKKKNSEKQKQTNKQKNTPLKPGIDRTSLVLKGNYQKPKVNIRLNDKTLNTFLLRSGTKQNICSHHFFSTFAR